MTKILTEVELAGYTAPSHSPGWQRLLDSHRHLLRRYGEVVGRCLALELCLQEHGIPVDSPNDGIGEGAGARRHDHRSFATKLAQARDKEGNYLLPDESGVRVECLPCYGTGYMGYTKDFPCKICNRRGFTVLDPTTGGDTWAQAITTLWTAHEPRRLTDENWRVYTVALMDYKLERARGHTPAALEAAYKAFVAAGIVKEETP